MSAMMSSLALFSRARDLCCVANCSITPFCRGKDAIVQIFRSHGTIVRVHNLRRDSQEEDAQQPCAPSQIKTTKMAGKSLTSRKVLQQQCAENWLLSLAASCNVTDGLKSDSAREESLESCVIGGGLQSVKEVSPYPGHGWVLGIDPDVAGAVAVLRTDDSGFAAQVFDAPSVQVLVGKSIRRRLDARSIVSLIQGLGAPTGSHAYIEQSTPFPKDGKQGWWSGGFGYGLWIGILVASGFCVIPVPSAIWKGHFELSGRTSSKDESRAFASSLFPALSSLFKRKKDHAKTIRNPVRPTYLWEMKQLKFLMIQAAIEMHFSSFESINVETPALAVLWPSDEEFVVEDTCFKGPKLAKFQDFVLQTFTSGSL